TQQMRRAIPNCRKAKSATIRATQRELGCTSTRHRLPCRFSAKSTKTDPGSFPRLPPNQQQPWPPLPHELQKSVKMLGIPTKSMAFEIFTSSLYVHRALTLRRILHPAARFS